MPTVVLLDKSTHNRESFNCGVESLDSYIRHQASQDVAKRAAICYVLVDDTGDPSRIIGYYTLANQSVELSGLPDEMIKAFPKYPQVPATLVGRLAVDVEYTGQRLGEFLLMDCLNTILVASDTTASAVVVVDAIDEVAAEFYGAYGFKFMPGSAARLFIPMTTVSELFED